MTSLYQNCLGLDISKDKLDLFDSVEKRATTSPNDLASVRKLIRTYPTRVFVFEATGGCDHVLRSELTRARVPFARIDGRRVREFAKASGALAKTDRVDAHVIAEYGKCLQPDLRVEPSGERARLAALAHRRDQLVGDIVAAKNRLKQSTFADITRDIERQLRFLLKERDRIDEKISAHKKAHEEIARDDELLRSAPGVGVVVATALIADLPELGQCNRRQIAALAGLAPFANESGRYTGKRNIWGGRARVRRALYIAALHASRSCPHMRAMRERMAARGKQTKTILIAIARKLLVALNAMMAKGTKYVSPPIPAI